MSTRGTGTCDAEGARDVTYGAPIARRTEAGPFTVSTAEFGSELFIPSHYHEGACLSVVLEGRFLQRFPNKECDCPAAGVIAKAPGERHVDEWYARRSHHVIIELDPARHDELGSSRGLFEGVFFRRDGRAHAVGGRIRHELANADDLTPTAVHGLVLEMVSGLLRESLPSGETDNPPPWLRRVRDRLHDRFAATPSLAEMAREAGVHPSHLSRTFGEHFGVGFGAYQRRLRLEAAKRALRDSRRPIGEIAVTCGFSDQSHLTRLLKRDTGLTPGAFRRGAER
jgi:AraC family transcriptional regulator